MRGAWTCTLVVLWPLVAARADGRDYDPAHTGWNGLSELLHVAERSGIDLNQPPRLDLAALDPGDAILLIDPQTSLPQRALSRFMQAGGRVALLDDLGTGDALLHSFEIERRPLALAADVPTLRGEPSWPIATPQSAHPLTEGVSALVTNHPRTFVHPHLQPILGLGSRAQAVVFTGAVGAGRFVAVSDASVVINNMLEFRGNRRFAENLLRYLSGEQHGRVWLSVGATALAGGEPMHAEGKPLAAVRKELARFARQRLPARAVLSSAWVIGLGLLFAAATALPRPSTYEQVHPPIVPATQGQLRHMLRGPRNMLVPLLQYREELVLALGHALALPAGADRAALLSAMKRRARVDSATAESAGRLLATLDRAAQQAEASHPARVSPRRFRTLIARGSAILSALQTTGS